MPRVGVWVVVAVGALSYPLLVLVFSGTPAFPSRTDCVRPPTDEGELQVVFGYRESELEALELRDYALEVGFQGTEIERDACGRVRVVVDDIPSLEVGQEVIRQARTVDLDPTLEQEG